MTTRQNIISDVIKIYIKNNSKEYKEFLKLQKQRRGRLKDRKLASFKDGKGRHEISLPAGIYNALNEILQDPPFLNDGTGQEMRWFVKKFPQFLIPYEY